MLDKKSSLEGSFFSGGSNSEEEDEELSKDEDEDEWSDWEWRADSFPGDNKGENCVFSFRSRKCPGNPLTGSILSVLLLHNRLIPDGLTVTSDDSFILFVISW